MHSGSKDVISGEQFGELLLRCTQLSDKDIKEYIERLKSRQGNKIVSYLYVVLNHSLCGTVINTCIQTTCSNKQSKQSNESYNVISSWLLEVSVN